jgi:serine/threonine protein phosphatase 1
LVRPGKVSGCNTAACHGGRVTALVLPDFQFCSVPAREDHWSVVRGAWQADLLAAKPRREMIWRDLDEHLAQFHGLDEARAHAYVAALRGWREALAARMTEVFNAIHADARRVAALDVSRAEARAHPLAGFVFQCLGGRFDWKAFERGCRTPAKLEEFGEALGFSSVKPPLLLARKE